MSLVIGLLALCAVLLAACVWLLRDVRAVVRGIQHPQRPSLFAQEPSPETVRMVSRAVDDARRRGAIRHVEYDGPPRPARPRHLA